MKIKIKEGLYPLVLDGEYTGKHFYLTPGWHEADMFVPGFARLNINSQEVIIEVYRNGYVSMKDNPEYWRSYVDINQ